MIRILLISLCLLFIGCSIKPNLPLLRRECKVIGTDSICSIIKNDTLLYSYFVKYNKANGLFQSFKKGRVFSQGIMIDSLKHGIWRFYDAEGDLDSVIYYFEDLKTTTLDKNDYEFTPKHIVSDKIEIHIPKGWDFKEGYEQTILLTNKPTAENGFTPNITLVKDKAKLMSFSNYCNSVYNMVSSQFQNVKLVNASDRFIDGLRAKEFVFVGTNSQLFLGCVVFVIDRGDYNYIYTGTAGNSSDGNFIIYKGLLEEIIMSTKFKQ